MVRTLPFHHWGASHFVSRVRPGIAISIAFHAGLFLCLAYALSFSPKKLAPPDDDPDKLTAIFERPPPPVTPPKMEKLPIFKPMPVQTLHTAPINVLKLPIPPQTFERTEPAKAVTQAAMAAPPIIKNPTPLYRGGLVFPDRAAERNQSGYVDFTFTIEPDGSVGDPVMVEEFPKGYGFAAAALRAFPAWKFAPKLIDGKPVAAPAQIRISFELK